MGGASPLMWGHYHLRHHALTFTPRVKRQKLRRVKCGRSQTLQREPRGPSGVAPQAGAAPYSQRTAQECGPGSTTPSLPTTAAAAAQHS
eukprot:5898507-Pyramimonas_sp.AAC.1